MMNHELIYHCNKNDRHCLRDYVLLGTNLSPKEIVKD